MLNETKESFGFRNVWLLDGRIYYLTEGCTKLKKSEIELTACLNYAKKPMA